MVYCDIKVCTCATTILLNKMISVNLNIHDWFNNMSILTYYRNQLVCCSFINLIITTKTINYNNYANNKIYMISSTQHS